MSRSLRKRREELETHPGTVRRKKSMVLLGKGEGKVGNVSLSVELTAVLLRRKGVVNCRGGGAIGGGQCGLHAVLRGSGHENEPNRCKTRVETRREVRQGKEKNLKKRWWKRRIGNMCEGQGRP